MASEVWFRNPHNYARELVEAGAPTNIAFDRGVLRSRMIDPMRWASLYFGVRPLRLLAVGEQGTAELRAGYSLDKPYAVYPTWVYGEDSMQSLEFLLKTPAGENEKWTDNKSVAADERPVRGQEHRVVVTRLPLAHSGVGRRFFADLAEMQQDYPECILHIHGLYSWRLVFGQGFRSGDVDPRAAASKGAVILPMGKEMRRENLFEYQKWVHMLGYSLPELEPARMRCIYNIKSAMWASQNYASEVRFRVRPSPSGMPMADEKKLPAYSRYKRIGAGDKFLCDVCSLASTCRLFREGAVCTVPGADTNGLAKLFKTRESGSIIEGLGDLMAMQAQRIDEGRTREANSDELDPDLSKIIADTFKMGERLARLIDPALMNPKTAVIIQNGGGQPGQLPAADPKAVVARIVRELEMQGIARKDITPEMITNVLAVEPTRQPAMIEAVAVVHTDGD